MYRLEINKFSCAGFDGGNIIDGVHVASMAATKELKEYNE